MLKWLDEHLEEYILFILLVIMTIVMGIQIVARFVFGNSLSWSEELVRYLFVWSAFIGVPYCIKKGTSVKVDQFRNMLPVSIQKVLLYVDKIIMLALFSVIVYQSLFVLRSSFRNGNTSPAMEIPIWLVQGAIFVGSLLAVIRNIQNLIKLFTGKKKVVQKHDL
ncbi:MAG: TRAP transporter small permease [Fusobacteriaceae bacterium]|jgi:TRAP-type C4-dicarboxylate transport system permease small subunit|nr:TRAP transporter small permease [Fusobacteriaceae bacterium]